MTDPEGVYTYKDRVAELRAREGELRAQRLADWRARHPEALCSDAVATALADIEAMALRKRTKAEVA